MTKAKTVLANWKMNMTADDVRVWCESFCLAAPMGVNTVVAPSFVHLPLVQSLAHHIKLAAQDVAAFSKGAHTGEIGAFQLKDFCKYCIVGHSERKETTQTINQKIDQCLANRIIPIVCFVTSDQAQRLHRDGVMFLWEDPANISVNGVFKPKDPAQTAKEIEQIRRIVGHDVEIIYGGSVNRDNAMDIAQIAGLNGVVTGSASLDPQHFLDIVMAFEVHQV